MIVFICLLSLSQQVTQLNEFLLKQATYTLQFTDEDVIASECHSLFRR